MDHRPGCGVRPRVGHAIGARHGPFGLTPMAALDRDVGAAAALLIQRYGEQARQHACRRVDRLLVRGDVQARMLWSGVIAAIDELQQRARAARWRERAEEYRICAQACVSAGARIAYGELAKCADGIADSMELDAGGEEGRRDGANELIVTARAVGGRQISRGCEAR